MACRLPITICAVLLSTILVSAGAAATPSAQTARARVSSRIVLYKSVGGFALGVTPGAVRRRLGKPSETIRVSGRIAQYTYDGLQLTFGFDALQPSDPADLVGAIGPRYRTSKGIHVGSSEKSVKRAYHGLRCNHGLCDLYKGTPGTVGSTDTAFDFFDGKVEGISVQKVYE